MHEASMHKENTLVTLTYNNEHLPKDGTLLIEDVQAFIKKVRKAYPKVKLKYFGCGEYGEKKARPHYHLILFGMEFEDKVYYKHRTPKSRFSNVTEPYPVWRSPTLDKLWNKGRTEIGTVNFKSAAYLARYVLEKVNGEGKEEHYKRYECDQHGEVIREYELKPEFGIMSRRPGIGAAWFEKYINDCRKGFITLDGQKVTLPRYYRKLLEKSDEAAAKADKRTRKSKLLALKKADELSPRRMRDKELIKKQQIQSLKRGNLCDS